MPSVTADNTNKAPATTAGAASLPTDIDSEAAASKNVTTTAAREKELATRREAFNSRKYSLSESDDEEEEGGAIDKRKDKKSTSKIGNTTDDNNNDDAKESPQIITSLEDQWNDANAIPPKKKLAYILFLAKSGGIKDFDVTNTYPYEEYINNPTKGRKINKSSFVLPKELVAKEIKRRNPNARPNPKNASLDKLESDLAKLPLNEEDVVFLKEQEARYRQVLTAQLQAEQTESGVAGRITGLDRLRYILCLVSDEIRPAYLRSQRCKDGKDIDYSNSEKRDAEWYELIVEMFNDPDVVLHTSIVKDLHQDYSQVIECPKGSYKLTVEKAKEVLQDMKTRLRDIIKRYNSSGNGSDMVIYEEDSDADDRIVVNDDTTYGRFNKDKALKRAQKKNDDSLLLTDGDDRSSFLRHQPPELLYWWHMMDQYNLLFFTCTILSDYNGASSTRTPGATSRHNKTKKSKEDDPDSTSAKRTKFEKDQLKVQKDMSTNVRQIGSSMKTMAYANIASQREALADKRFELKMQLVQARKAGDDDMVDIFQERIAELSSSIEKHDALTEGSDAGPRHINFDSSATSSGSGNRKATHLSSESV